MFGKVMCLMSAFSACPALQLQSGATPKEGIPVFVTSLDGTEHEVQCDPNSTIAEIKEKTIAQMGGSADLHNSFCMFLSMCL